MGKDSRANVGHEVVHWVQARLIGASIATWLRTVPIAHWIRLGGSIVNAVSWLLTAILKCVLKTKPVSNFMDSDKTIRCGKLTRVFRSHEATVVDNVLASGVRDRQLAFSTGDHVLDIEEI
jgi:hypothetical protein